MTEEQESSGDRQIEPAAIRSSGHHAHDYSARVQTVTRKRTELLRLIREFERQTGCARHQHVVQRPGRADRAPRRTPTGVSCNPHRHLVMDVLLNKESSPREGDDAWQKEFQLD